MMKNDDKWSPAKVRRGPSARVCQSWDCPDSGPLQKDHNCDPTALTGLRRDLVTWVSDWRWMVLGSMHWSTQLQTSWSGKETTKDAVLNQNPRHANWLTIHHGNWGICGCVLCASQHPSSKPFTFNGLHLKHQTSKKLAMTRSCTVWPQPITIHHNPRSVWWFTFITATWYIFLYCETRVTTKRLRGLITSCS